MKKYLALVLTLTAFQHIQSATYYISYTDGANGNPGTKAQPWKYLPLMWGWSGSYSHVAGDRFILKGGDTWPNNCFTYQISYSGTPGNEDYYGVDTTWYRGTSFTKPRFDGQGIELMRNTGTYDVFVQFLNQAQHDVIIDNIIFTGMYWQGLQAIDTVVYLKCQSSTNITISNCEFRNWTHAPYGGASYEDQGICISGSNQTPYNSGSIITNCVFDGENVANLGLDGKSSGQAAIWAWGGRIVNCTVKNTAGGIFPAGALTGRVEVSGCTVGPMFISYDPTMHHDGIQDNGGRGVILHDNYFVDIAPVPCFLGAGWGGGTYDIYNNIFDLRSQTTQQPIVMDCQAGGNTFYIYNNTLVAGPGITFLRANWRSTGGNNIALLDVRNNHLIGEGSLISIDAGVTIASSINQNNIITTYANAVSLGYTKANKFRPTSSSSLTVDVGQDLSSYRSGALLLDYLGVVRPQALLWDIGCYEYQSGVVSSKPATPTITQPINNTSGLPVSGFTCSVNAYSDPQSTPMLASRWLFRQGSSIVFDYVQTNTSLSISVPSGALAYGTTYTLSAALENTTGVWSDFSTPISFSTLVLQAPYAPTIISPINGTTNVSLTPTIIASAYSHPQNFAQVSRNWRIYSGPTAIYNVTNSPSLSIIVPNGILSYFNAYGATARDLDINGNWGAEATLANFTTIPTLEITNQLPSGMILNFEGSVILKGKFTSGQ